MPFRLDGGKISFEEPLSVNGEQITIVYSGTLAGDELKLSRNVGTFGTEQLIAKHAGLEAFPIVLR